MLDPWEARYYGPEPDPDREDESVWDLEQALMETRERQARERQMARELGLPDCGVCGEPPDGEMAEVYDPQSTTPGYTCKVVHASCIPEGWELA
jgi:hypothetical protein